MPIYEYACQECGHELERLQKMSDDPLRDCPACDRPGLRRKVSAAGFRLKGGGWYETDFKQGQKRNLVDSGGESKPSGDAKPEASDAPEPAKKEPKADKTTGAA